MTLGDLGHLLPRRISAPPPHMGVCLGVGYWLLTDGIICSNTNPPTARTSRHGPLRAAARPTHRADRRVAPSSGGKDMGLAKLVRELRIRKANCDKLHFGALQGHYSATKNVVRGHVALSTGGIGGPDHKAVRPNAQRIWSNPSYTGRRRRAQGAASESH